MDKLLQIQMADGLNLTILEPFANGIAFAKRESLTLTNNSGSIGWFDWLRVEDVGTEVIGVRLYVDMLEEDEKFRLLKLKPWVSLSPTGRHVEILFRLDASFNEGNSTFADLGFSGMSRESELNGVTLYFQIKSQWRLGCANDCLIE